MREIHSTLSLKAGKDHAAYILTAEDAPINYDSLSSYLTYAAGRPLPRHIRPQLTSAHSNPDSFCASFLERDPEVAEHSIIKQPKKLLMGGTIKDWSLTAVEVLPGEIRLHLIHRGLFRRYDAALRKARQQNPDYARKTDAEIAAAEQLTPFTEVLTCRATNPVLASHNVVTINFDVPRHGASGTDVYSIGFNDNYTTIGEPAGFGQRYLKIKNDAGPATYTAEVIELQ